MATVAPAALPVLHQPQHGTVAEQINPNDEQLQQQQRQQQQQERAAAAAVPTIESIEKELSVLAALPRPVRCRRVVPETAFAMLETVIQRLLNEAAEAVDGATFSSSSTVAATAAGKQDKKKTAVPSSAPSSSRPGSVVFLERADVWCDALDEFAETAQLYGGDVPLSADQLSALNHAALSNSKQHQMLQQQQQEQQADTAGSPGVMVSGGNFVDDAAAGDSSRHQQQKDDAAAATSAAAATPKKKGPDSLAVNTAHSSERDSLATRQHPQHQMRGVSPSRSPGSPTLSLTVGSGGAPSPLRHSESQLMQLVVDHHAATSAGTTAGSHNIEGNPASFSSSAVSFPPPRRALLLKIQVKERLRDVFVQMAQELAGTINVPKSYFPPPAVERALRNLKAVQAEASKFAALTVELYSELEKQLADTFQETFLRARQLASDKGWVSSVTDRSRKERMQRVAGLITDVYLVLAELDSRRSDVTVSVCRALLSLAGLESRRSNHDSALQLATEGLSRLGKLYAKEATIINEFRATASAEAMQQQMALQHQQEKQQLGYGSVLAPSSFSTFRFLCQVHESFGAGFPAPLELITDEQHTAMGQVIVALQKRIKLVIPLRVAAHFNRASELEHTGAAAAECKAEYTAALTAGSSPRLPDFGLSPQHPLMVKVSDALSSLVAAKFEKQRAARFPTSAAGGTAVLTGPARAASATNNKNNTLPPLAATSSDGSRMQPRPPPPGQQQQPRTARTPNAPSMAFSRAQDTAAAAAGFSSATVDRSARVIGGAEFSRHVTSGEMEGAKLHGKDTTNWGPDQRGGTGADAEDKNLEMLKKFGIVPENMESLTKKKQQPISEVAHLDDNFIADPEQQQQQQAQQSTSDSGGMRRREVVAPLGVESEQQQRSRRGGDPQQQQQHPQYHAQLDKQLEEKLSNRQTNLLSGVHGLMDARSNKTHALYEAELDAVIVRCKQAFTVRDQAARVIQRAWRCAVARLEAHNRRQVFYHFLFQAQKAAGTAILSTYRKHRQQQAFLGRREQLRATREALAKEELKKRNASITITRAIKRFKSQRLLEADLMRKLRIVEREKLVRTDVAAAIVQRWWKVIKHEARYWRQRNDQMRKSKLEEAMALKYHAAASTIQRVFRGHVGRFEARVVKTRVMERRMALRRSVNYAADTVRTLLLEWRARQNRMEMLAQQNVSRREAAQRTIRGGWYDALERRKMKIVRARAREVSLSARRVQCWWRCVLARRELRYKRKVSQTITMVRIRSEWSRLRAACAIQGVWRIHAARKVLRGLKAGVGREIINAIWRLQRAGRSYFVRQSLCKERDLLQKLTAAAFAQARDFRHEQVVTIQRFMYPRTSQRLGRDVLERRLQERVVVWRSMRCELKEDRRAQFLQAVGRGFFVRAQVMPVLRQAAAALARKQQAAAGTIQRGWKCSCARDELRKRKDRKARLFERQKVWVEVQGTLHVDRVATLALMEQTARQAMAKHQRDIRRDIVRAYFAPVVLAAQQQQQQQQVVPAVASPNAVASDETPTGTTAAPGQQRHRPSSAASSNGSSSSSSSPHRRILDMYDDSDEEQEKTEFVQWVLNRPPPVKTAMSKE